jgi:Cd2+/Zn2+-exporting ATPase
MENLKSYELKIKGLDCAECAKGLEASIRNLPEVKEANLNFMTAKLKVVGGIERPELEKMIKELGYAIESSAKTEQIKTKGGIGGFLRFMLRELDSTLTVVGFVLILPALLFHELLPFLNIDSPIFDWMSLTALVVAGYPIVRSAIKSLIFSHEISINMLMTIAGIGAIFMGEFAEAGLVMVLFSLGESLEGFSMERARDSIGTLMQVVPETATVLRPCMDCKEHLGKDGYVEGPCPICGTEETVVGVDELQIGDIIIVKPGERIPMDGKVLKGSSNINQSQITGESMPVPKNPGDKVFAGTINHEGALEIEVTTLSKDNTIARMIRLVEEAQEKRAKTQKFVDRFAKYYTPTVMVLAILVASIPPLLFNLPFLQTSTDQGWLYKALELLVISCPCALVISVPVALVTAINLAAKNGILIKGGVHLETLAKVKAVAFDKTGTLTVGKPNVVRVHSVDCQANDSKKNCQHCDDLLAVTSAVEKRSEHPVAMAVVNAAQSKGLSDKYKTAEDVKSVAGKGVAGKVNGENVFVGSHTHFDNEVPHSPEECNIIDAHEAQGQTPVLVSRDGKYIGFISVADTVRGSAKEAVHQLRIMGVKDLVMLTGDNAETAKTIADQAGITDVKSDLLPEQKLRAVTDLKDKFKDVAMVGDGVNDAPALAASSVGIAMGASGTAQALETSDVALMGEDLNKIPFVIRLAKSAMNIIKFNIGFILVIKAAFFAIVLAGYGSMWLAVIADVGATMLVTLNGMRILRFK